MSTVFANDFLPQRHTVRRPTGSSSTPPARRSAGSPRSSRMRLRASTRPDYSPHVDMGDNIIVLNAEKIRVTGNKLSDKFYYQHTGYIGNLKSIALGKLLKEHPERAIEIAVKGMLPKNTLGRKMFRKLHVFAGGKHPHTGPAAQAAGPVRPFSHPFLRDPTDGRVTTCHDQLRHRPTQDRHGPRLPQARQRQDHRQRAFARRVLRSRDRPHDRPPAARAHAAGRPLRRQASGRGGGITGQAGAIRHGITRALMSYDETLRKPAARRRLRHARRARGRAQEGRPPQGPSRSAVLEALSADPASAVSAWGIV
jgi:large subunit ribosomal protein L13